MGNIKNQMTSSKLLVLFALISLALAVPSRDPIEGRCKPFERGCDASDFLTHQWEWRWFGALSWLRALDGANFWVYFPMAIAWTTMNRGSTINNNDKRFYWIMFKWVGVAGWLSSFWNIITGIALIRKGGDWKNTTYLVQDFSRTEEIVGGITMIIDQIIGQVLYYFFRPGAVKAAQQYIVYYGGEDYWSQEYKYLDWETPDWKYLDGVKITDGDEEELDGSSF